MLNGGQCVTFTTHSYLPRINTVLVLYLSRMFDRNLNNYRGGSCLISADRGGGRGSIILGDHLSLLSS